MNEKQRMQEQANGIILACSTFISDLVVSRDQVEDVLGTTGVTKEEWETCQDEYSKQQILEKLDGSMRWLDE